MGLVFSFCNQKGGVGKTTSALNVSSYVAQQGFKTLVIDMDAQGNATSGLGVEKPEIELTTYQLFVDNIAPMSLIQKTPFQNLDIIPANSHLAGADLELVSKIGREYTLKNKIPDLTRNYDFVFIDCPPSLGLTTVNSLTASDYLIIPLQCEYYALEGLGQLVTTYQLIKRNLNPELEIGGVLLTMADFRTNLTQQVIEEVKEHFKDKVFDAVIPRSVKVSEAPSFGKPAILYEPSNRGSKGYFELGLEFVARFTDMAQPAERVNEQPVVSEEVKKEERRELAIAPPMDALESTESENVEEQTPLPGEDELKKSLQEGSVIQENKP